MISLEPSRLTHADYDALEEGAPYQLIDGALVTSPSPTFFHQRLVIKFARWLMEATEDHGIGVVVPAPIDVYLGETEAYQPDVLFISNERKAIITKNKIHGAPDLVVEVLSPSTGYYDLTKKRRVYESAGVREYWLVDPMERTVTVLFAEDGAFIPHEEAAGSDTVTSRLIEGFAIDLDVLFAL